MKNNSERVLVCFHVFNNYQSWAKRLIASFQTGAWLKVVSQSMGIMAIRVVKFSSGGYFNVRNFCLSKLLNFENLLNQEVSKSAKIWFTESIFYVKKYPNLSQYLHNPYCHNGHLSGKLSIFLRGYYERRGRSSSVRDCRRSSIEPSLQHQLCYVVVCTTTCHYFSSSSVSLMASILGSP